MSSYKDDTGYTERTISFSTVSLKKFKRWLKKNDIRNSRDEPLSVNQGIYSMFMSFISDRCGEDKPEQYFAGTSVPKKELFEEPTEVELI